MSSPILSAHQIEPPRQVERGKLIDSRKLDRYFAVIANSTFAD